MRPDGLIKRDVEDELSSDPRIDDSGIAVSVSDGVVTLGGVVQAHGQRAVVIQIAEWVSGLPVAAAQLVVNVPDIVGFSDRDIACRAENAIRWDVEVPSSRLSVHVAGGELTLEGNVCWDFERRAAERAVGHIIGVRKLVNRIEVVPQRLELHTPGYLSSNPASIANRT